MNTSLLTKSLPVCRRDAWGRAGSQNGPGVCFNSPSLLSMVEVGKALLKAMAYVHRCGVLHRGLTPDHVLVSPPLPSLPGVSAYLLPAHADVSIPFSALYTTSSMIPVLILTPRNALQAAPLGISPKVAHSDSVAAYLSSCCCLFLISLSCLRTETASMSFQLCDLRS